ncbi:class I SAM-dependent methyltransferase [Candidatus Falkowbacteria bacterium]|nr:class I SAM-dependent methyltransferase [Candidatus Falkowbacteria bacterium]
MEKINQIGDIYNSDAVSKYYDSRDAYEKVNPADRELFQHIPFRLDGKVVLDVGCGDGRHSVLMYRRNPKKVIAMDLSPSMLERVQARKDNFGLDRLDIVQADIDHLQLPKESVDFILSRFSLMYSKNLGEAMKGLGEALKPGGEVVIEASVAEIDSHEGSEKIKSAPVALKLQIANESMEIMNYAYSLDDYHKAFRDTGFSVEVQKRFPANDLSVSEDYAHKDSVKFDYIVFKLKKLEESS